MKKYLFDTVEDIEDILENGDYTFSKEIVDAVLLNMNEDVDNFVVMQIEARDADYVYEITFNKSDLYETLQTHLPVIEEEEDYETCGKIIEALNFLKKQNGD